MPPLGSKREPPQLGVPIQVAYRRAHASNQNRRMALDVSSLLPLLSGSICAPFTTVEATLSHASEKRSSQRPIWYSTTMRDASPDFHLLICADDDGGSASGWGTMRHRLRRRPTLAITATVRARNQSAMLAVQWRLACRSMCTGAVGLCASNGCMPCSNRWMREPRSNSRGDCDRCRSSLLPPLFIGGTNNH